MRALNTWLVEATGRSRPVVAVPDCVAALMARYGGWAPGAPMTWDQWLMLKTDNVARADAEGFAAFEIAPAPLAAVAPSWLVRYRRGGRFALPAS
jgi:NADH dehydrogenase